MSVTLPTVTLDEVPPYTDTRQRPVGHYAEAESYRGAMRGYTKSRLGMIFGAANPAIHESVRFWFRNLHSAQSLYYIMDNWYEKKGTYVKDLLAIIPNTSERTLRAMLKDAQRLGLLHIEHDNEDARLLIIWPTVLLCTNYEESAFEHLETMMTFDNTQDVFGVLDAYREFKKLLADKIKARNDGKDDYLALVS